MSCGGEWWCGVVGIRNDSRSNEGEIMVINGMVRELLLFFKIEKGM